MGVLPHDLKWIPLMLEVALSLHWVEHARSILYCTFLHV